MAKRITCAVPSGNANRPISTRNPKPPLPHVLLSHAPSAGPDTCSDPYAVSLVLWLRLVAVDLTPLARDHTIDASWPGARCVTLNHARPPARVFNCTPCTVPS